MRKKPASETQKGKTMPLRGSFFLAETLRSVYLNLPLIIEEPRSWHASVHVTAFPLTCLAKPLSAPDLDRNHLVTHRDLNEK